jgi:hypothetical protein
MITAAHSQWVSTIGRVVAVAAMLAVLGACSSFDGEWSRWAAVEAAPAPTARGSIEGRWEGKWVSAGSGHEGALRCLVTATAMPPSASIDHGAYVFRFSATWGPGIVSEYEITMITQKKEDRIVFEGEMDLGLLMGSYRCIGFIKDDQFSATYEAKGDHGTFEMARPEK